MAKAKRIKLNGDLFDVQFTVADIHALQRVYAGDATPEQQKRAMSWILTDLCRIKELGYHENDRDTAFAQGRKFPGLKLAEFITINLENLKKKEGGTINV